MKSSRTPQTSRKQPASPSSEQKTSTSSTPNPADLPPSSRPSLSRSSPNVSRSSKDSLTRTQSHPQGQASSTDVNTPGNEDSSTGEATPKGMDNGEGSERKSSVVSSPNEAEIARLRAAVQSRLFSKQQKVPKGTQSPSSVSSFGGGRKPSPIREENPSSISPMSSAFANPLASTKTSSTESTSSSRTIRGSAANTPAAHPLRTPSYPFPYVPGTPRAWPGSFHQPFTILSPTTSAGPAATPSDNTISGASTPNAARLAFAPEGTTPQSASDPRYGSPNLYDLVLSLNAEPGLDSWWGTVTQIMNDAYMADRVSLALPADSTDIENVPWGQKATYNACGKTESSEGGTSPGIVADQPRVPRPHIVGARPGMPSRHSYAGPAPRDTTGDRLGDAIPRPSMLRTVSYAPEMMRRDTASTVTGRLIATDMRHTSLTDPRHTSLTDPDFSSIGGDSAMPQLSVFPVLRGLDHEVDTLLDTSGVNRVLERGKIVTLTRDYVFEQSNGPLDGTTRGVPPGHQQDQRSAAEAQQTSSTSTAKSSNAFRNIFGSLDPGSQRRGSVYEEYEQTPPSPWAQSPAPSPAVQADPEINPFFSSQENVEDSFNPSAPSPDYSRLEPMEAIGVDRANTVIHIPLVHPTLSPVMPVLESSGYDESEEGLRAERRAPIAIISILSSAVPYPQNLTQSLQFLGPHLATSYVAAHQLTAIQNQALGVRHRRVASGRNAGFTPLSIEPGNLDDLIVKGDFEEVGGSMSGSITSPSDYSGRSKHSPAGSTAGTPGWDTSWNRSLQGTPAAFSQGEHADNYFDARKPLGGHRPVSGTIAVTPSKNGRRSPSHEPRSSSKKGSSHTDEDRERKYRTQAPSKAEKLPARAALPLRQHSPPRASEGVISTGRVPSTRASASHDPYGEGAQHTHSVLHSYGADFASSFQSLPASTSTKTPAPPTPHARQSSVSETSEMPPPSERLLRTIIDSLPVQIFTAAPGTGDLTWVNSKFLVYRGQDSRKVLKEPWEAIHPEDRLAYMEQWNKSLRTGQQLQQKVRLQRFDGNYRWFYVRAAPLKDKRQRIVHWIGTNMDFHEQHLAEMNSARQQETAASEAKYRALANSSPQVVFTVTKSRGVTFCNTQWVNYSGQTEAQALALGFMEHVHADDIVKCRLPSFEDGAVNVPTSVPPETRRTFSSSQASTTSSDTERAPTSPLHSSPTTQMPQRKLSELASTGILKVSRDPDGKPSYSTEVRLRTKDGEYRWHLVRVVMVGSELNSEGEEETWYGTCTDINDHKALERDLKETMDEKSRFLSNMSHEIRTPLNGITGMVNFLIDSSMTAEQMEHVSIIRASTEGLRGLINDILDLSKAEAGMIQLNMDWMHVQSLIEEVNDLTSAMAIDKGLELNYLVEENVPSQIKADRFRIRQILLNVIGNAIKFTQVGEVFVRCSVLTDSSHAPTKDEMYIQFEVIDTGSGFTEKEAQYLFKRFSQIDGSSTRQHGGTGLGLVISRQLAQLHGGDMSAKGTPGKGSSFSFHIKTTLPTELDPAPTAAVTPAVTPAFAPGPPEPQMKHALPIPRATNTVAPSTGKTGSPRLLSELTQTPSPYLSPASSASSDPSVRTNRTSIRSERSSASSYMMEPALQKPTSPMQLAMPSDSRPALSDSNDSQAAESSKSLNLPTSIRTLSPGGSLSPPMFSILVVCPLKYSREATVQHMDMTLPKNVPHQITARGSLLECQKMLGGDDPMIFSHVVLVLQSVPEIIAIVDQIFSSPSHSPTQIIVITDLAQKRKMMEQAPEHKYDLLATERRLRFIFKPLKPSKFAFIFDPQKEREMSTDRNQDSAQQVALTQKQVYDEMKRRLGNQTKRVLLVEDNRVNQMVLLKFLSKVSIQVETVLDGVQCTEKIYAKPHGYYSIILCDLHMPNKDGYQTCREIRKWEKKNKHPYLPIIALSANVLGDVWAKCVEAGFNSYVTKPVDFKELSTVMLTFMDPSDPSRPIEFMKPRKT